MIDDDSDGAEEAAALHADVVKALRDDNVPDIRRAFEDVLDTAATSRSSQAWSLPEQSASELDEDRRFEAELRSALSRRVTERLAGQGIFCVGALDDGTGGAWVFHARDGAGRPYEARLDFASENALTAASGEGPLGLVDRLVDSVCRSLLAERERWFRRMRS